MPDMARRDMHDERNTFCTLFIPTPFAPWNEQDDAIVGTSDDDTSDEGAPDPVDTERQEQEDKEYDDDYDDSDGWFSCRYGLTDVREYASSEEEEEEDEATRAKVIKNFEAEVRLEAMCGGFVAVPTVGWHFE